jgi:hypothetical protein
MRAYTLKKPFYSTIDCPTLYKSMHILKDSLTELSTTELRMTVKEASLLFTQTCSFSTLGSSTIRYDTITVRYDTNTVRYDTIYHMVFLPTFSHGIFPYFFHIHSHVLALSFWPALSPWDVHMERYTTTLPLG